MKPLNYFYIGINKLDWAIERCETMEHLMGVQRMINAFEYATGFYGRRELFSFAIFNLRLKWDRKQLTVPPPHLTEKT